MKIGVIGGGPAGLYFAAYIKQRRPSCQVDLYEKTEFATEGIGYTLHSTVLDSLDSIDPDLVSNLRPIVTPSWNMGLVQVGSNRSKLVGMPYLSGIKRDNLVSYLINLAQSAGVEIHKGQKIILDDIDKYRAQYDMLVGADGVNSQVRQKYREHFKVRTIEGNNPYIWFSGTPPTHGLKLRINESNGHVFISHSYPVSKTAECIIVECTAQGFQNLGFNEPNCHISNPNMRKLEDILRGDIFNFQLEALGARWNKTKVNIAQRVAFENVALIGESAFSIHYVFGGGLKLAFEAARNLADSVLGSLSVENGIRTYDLISNDNSKAVLATLVYQAWLENVDEHFSSMSHDDFLKRFAERD